MKNVKTHIMFQGEADEALSLYKKCFVDFQVISTEVYKQGEDLPEGCLKKAEVDFAGHGIIIFNSPPIHNFKFTPSISIMTDCESYQELETAFKALSESGSVLMPLDNYGFSERFGWVQDQFGVSWQLNLNEGKI